MTDPLAQTAGLVHRIDPVICEFWGIRLWYYGLAYALGFLGVHLWFLRRHKEPDWSLHEAYDISILLAVCVLVFGRAFSVVVYQWPYFRVHLSQLFSYWRGGMATHGVLIGAVVGIWLFSRLRNKRFLEIADEVVIPGAFLLACGRIGNFINGEIYGSVTDAWWGVEFPAAEGFRHPVTLYEALKNLVVIPILLSIRRKARPGQGVLLAHFVFWYGFLRIFTDLFREYGAQFFGIGRGQYFNILMALLGLALLVWRSKTCARANVTETYREQRSAFSAAGRPGSHRVPLYVKRVVLAAVLCFSLVIRSGWTEGVLEHLRQEKAQPVALQHETAKAAGREASDDFQRSPADTTVRLLPSGASLLHSSCRSRQRSPSG